MINGGITGLKFPSETLIPSLGIVTKQLRFVWEVSGKAAIEWSHHSLGTCFNCLDFHNGSFLAYILTFSELCDCNRQITKRACRYRAGSIRNRGQLRSHEEFLKEHFKDYLVPRQISDHTLLNISKIYIKYFTL